MSENTNDSIERVERKECEKADCRKLQTKVYELETKVVTLCGTDWIVENNGLKEQIERLREECHMLSRAVLLEKQRSELFEGLLLDCKQKH